MWNKSIRIFKRDVVLWNYTYHKNLVPYEWNSQTMTDCPPADRVNTIKEVSIAPYVLYVCCFYWHNYFFSSNTFAVIFCCCYLCHRRTFEIEIHWLQLFRSQIPLVPYCGIVRRYLWKIYSILGGLVTT